MIRVLFIHQNLPGQFRRSMRYLETRPDYHVVAIGEETAVRREPAGPKVRAIGYARPDGPGEKTHHYLRHPEGCVHRGQAVARACVALKQEAFVPDVVVCHPGCGEALFVEDVSPRARLVVFCEFCWVADGLDVGFDPEYPVSFDGRLRIRIKNAVPMQPVLTYGRRPSQGHVSCRAALMAELEDRGEAVGWARVHFLGKVPYAAHRSASQVASQLVYPTYPFVLSSSMLGSDAAPVRAVIRDGENGFLAPCFDTARLAGRVEEETA